METITWVQPDGTTWKFDGSAGVVANLAPAERFMPPVAITTADVPGEPGTQITFRRFTARNLSLNLSVVDDDPAIARQTLRDLLVAFDPTNGDGRLRFETPANDTRDIVCCYIDGLQGDDGTSDPAQTEYLLQPKFFAADPFFTDPAETTNNWDITAGVSFLPILPIRLTASQVFATAPITNLGDVEAYPVWTVIGPGSDLVLEHSPTGRRLSWSGTLGAGEVLTIDTRSSVLSTTPKSVTLQDGTNAFASLDAWDFWPLSVGTQVVQIELAGATTDSSVSARWSPRYLGV